MQGLDRYAYVNNNPLRYTDPSGHNWEDCGRRSGYQCKIHTKHVSSAKIRFAREEIDSLIQATLDHPEDSSYAISALKAIAKYYNIHLAPGDNWDYLNLYKVRVGVFEQLDDAPYGITPTFGKYFYDEARNKIDLNDRSVYIFATTFSKCGHDSNCIAGVMAHEATHSWLEWKIDNETSLPRYSQATAAEELIADEVALRVSPQNLIVLEIRDEIHKGICDGTYQSPCLNPTKLWEDYYGISISNIYALVY